MRYLGQKIDPEELYEMAVLLELKRVNQYVEQVMSDSKGI